MVSVNVFVNRICALLVGVCVAGCGGKTDSDESPVLASAGQFVIAAEKQNVGAWNKIGNSQVAVTVSASDNSGNPVADGTKVYFVSQEGGIIDNFCQLQNGFCSVMWRPNGIQSANGRIQIFATIKGQEKYLDQNGNGIFDEDDHFYAFDPEYDLAEPYSDNNNNGMYDIAEHFVDSNGDAMWSPANGLWNGFNCQDSDRCDNSPIDLGAQTTLIIANEFNPTICEEGEFDLFPLTMETGGTVSLSGLFLSDGNSNAINVGNSVCSVGNPPPAGSMIRFSASAGELVGPTEYEVSSNQTNPLGPLGITYKAPEIEGPQQIVLSISLSSGEVISWVWSINVVGPLSQF